MGHDTRIQKGQHLSRSTEFKPGQHWREPKPWWQREWLEHQYVTLQRSMADIAKANGTGESNICFWIQRHGIRTRSMSEARKVKHWGAGGTTNPMFGKSGWKNPNWRGGLSPLRSRLYARSAWHTVVRKVRSRDKVCRLCGVERGLEIHHIDPFANVPLLALDEGNLILLCSSCHTQLRGKEKRWRKKLFKLINAERR
jgi:hypothetical protein